MSKRKEIRPNEIRAAKIQFPFETRKHGLIGYYGLNGKGEIVLTGRWSYEDAFSQSVWERAFEKPNFGEMALNLLLEADQRGDYQIYREGI